MTIQKKSLIANTSTKKSQPASSTSLGNPIVRPQIASRTRARTYAEVLPRKKK